MAGGWNLKAKAGGWKSQVHKWIDVTKKCGKLKDCIRHNHAPKIFKIIAGDKKQVYYVAICDSDDCTILTPVLENTFDAWNIHNM